jgi:hypothetical protein
MGNHSWPWLSENTMRNAKAKNTTEDALVNTNSGRQIPIRDFSIQWDFIGNIKAGN